MIEIFGELVAAELKILNQRQLLLVKHEIQNVIFKVRMQTLQSNSNARPKKLITQHPSTSSPVVSLLGDPLRPNCDSSETMRKLCLSTKCPHHEVRWNYGILRSGTMSVSSLSPDSFRWSWQKPAGIIYKTSSRRSIIND